MKTVKIEGMSCGKCVANIEKALSDVAGITKMDVTVGQAIIEGDVSNEVLTEAIEDFGFDVIEIK
ncbi:heavy metal-associated domain-containing protein [uncultured Clostridium sp.]|jgi:copper chaperone CopZ|uniref:heavy-metal-associated domain-containing protein n=1 Tax=uncultured Clostridium sp. TaxID=59620 RepID=UPI0026208F24|nr:heavy metal-associated domain-containing protein [uncultured Clostridium sp.]